MDIVDPIFLSRVQFAFTISFHILFPALTIGLASWLAVVEGLYMYTKKQVYMDIYRHWVRIFAVAFGMGVVSGVVMSYQFGTNWSIFSDRVGNVLGPLLGYEVLTAFFLEASFLGIMLFGRKRVSEKMHFFSTCVVAIGTLISAFWILSASSWMHTPTGFSIDGTGLYQPTSWYEIVFNPSFPYRFTHMIMGAYLTTAFFVGGISAWYLLRHKYIKHSSITFSMAMIMAIFVAPAQLVVGDIHGLNTLEHQPAKVAAMEGIWKNEKGAALRLFAFPDSKQETNHMEISIPKLASFILTHDWDGEIQGLKSWAPEDRPNVPVVFYSFRIMVGLGILMILTGLLAVWLYFRKKLFDTPWFFKLCIAMTPSGFIAILAGWFVTEVGRQPYLVYGLMRTAEGASKLATFQPAISLTAFVLVYTAVFGAGVYYILKLVRVGPDIEHLPAAYGVHGMRRPLTLADVFSHDD
ncbi:MAG: cytochrome ubiquinol oxidase subunit I [Alphaproteobacteria bacterium]